jgi:hypothetical protein
VLLLLSIAAMIAYTASHIGSHGCPAFVDRVNCRWGDLVSYVLQAVLFAGLPALLLSTALGGFIGWSLSDRKVLLWEGIIAGSFLLLTSALIFIGSLSETAYRALFGDGIQFKTLGLYLLGSIPLGAGVGAVLSRLSRRRKP